MAATGTYSEHATRKAQSHKHSSTMSQVQIQVTAHDYNKSMRAPKPLHHPSNQYLARLHDVSCSTCVPILQPSAVPTRSQQLYMNLWEYLSSRSLIDAVEYTMVGDMTGANSEDKML